MNLKKIFLAGAAKIFSPAKAPRRRQMTVAQALRGDCLKIAGDFRKVMNAYGRR